ncbi:endolysin [Edwardsiella phage KF-1]|uniref:Uncharacterized protein n=2 Tax=Edwardsiella phage KF-1 TaxID=1244856 RepID=K4PW91_9CAUD|nr:endolysin [Edwardsiella phage KF-1]BAM63082.1 hypothetical protein [Edwardsiella phage KF-1]BAM63131.1 hypothetical protein [Edwardsiella phage IW-1]
MYDKVIGRVLSHEGNYTADPKDRGNWTSGKCGVGQLKGTKYGISAMSYPDLDIKGLTWEQAKAIYKRDFWDKLNMTSWPDVLDFQVFDAAVNSGCGRAIKWLQWAARVNDDGIVGPKTIAAVQAMDPNDVCLRFLGKRLRFMTETSTWNSYGKGWARRISDNLLYAAEDN